MENGYGSRKNKGEKTRVIGRRLKAKKDFPFIIICRNIAAPKIIGNEPGKTNRTINKG